MTVYKRVSGAWVSSAPKKRVGGSMVNAASVKVRVASAWVEKLGMTLTLNHYEAVASSPAFPVVSPVVTCTATGGSGAAKTYAWSWVTGGVAIAIDAPASASTTFRITSGTTRNGTARCTVSDGTFTSTADVTVELSRAI